MGRVTRLLDDGWDGVGIKGESIVDGLGWGSVCWVGEMLDRTGGIRVVCTC